MLGWGSSQILYFRVAETREAEEATLQKSFSVLDTPIHLPFLIAALNASPLNGTTAV